MTWLVPSRCWRVRGRRSAFLCHSHWWCGWWRDLPCPSASPCFVTSADPGIGGAVCCGTSWDTYIVCHTYVAHVDESCHKYEWVIHTHTHTHSHTHSHTRTHTHTHAHTCTRTHTCHMCEWGMSCIRMSHITLTKLDEQHTTVCHQTHIQSFTRMSHTWMSVATHVHESRYACIWGMSHVHIELPAKLLNYFLRKNESNNQWVMLHIELDEQHAKVCRKTHTGWLRFVGFLRL